MPLSVCVCVCVCVRVCVQVGVHCTQYTGVCVHIPHAFFVIIDCIHQQGKHHLAYIRIYMHM